MWEYFKIIVFYYNHLGAPSSQKVVKETLPSLTLRFYLCKSFFFKLQNVVFIFFES
jgi:hypothetical protein